MLPDRRRIPAGLLFVAARIGRRDGWLCLRLTYSFCRRRRQRRHLHCSQGVCQLICARAFRLRLVTRCRFSVLQRRLAAQSPPGLCVVTLGRRHLRWLLRMLAMASITNVDIRVAVRAAQTRRRSCWRRSCWLGLLVHRLQRALRLRDRCIGSTYRSIQRVGVGSAHHHSVELCVRCSVTARWAQRDAVTQPTQAAQRLPRRRRLQAQRLFSTVRCARAAPRVAVFLVVCSLVWGPTLIARPRRYARVFACVRKPLLRFWQRHGTCRTPPVVCQQRSPCF